MSELNIYRATPRKVREYTIDCIEAGLVPFIQSDPAMGKSTIVKSIFDQYRLWMIDHRLSTSQPEDLSGLPEFYTDESKVRRARFCPFDIFPIESTPVPEGYDGFGLFLDEANSAHKSVQAASYKLVLDRMVGQHKLHKHLAMVMAGNLETSRAIVNSLSTAMQSRLIHIEMMISHLEWLEDVAIKQNYDSRIIAYLNYRPEDLMDFKPDHADKTFASPRTWEFMEKLIRGKEVLASKTGLYAGTITSGVAVSFVQFCSVIGKIPDRKAVLSDPLGAIVPQDSPGRWMVVAHLSNGITDDTFGRLCTYINRFGLDFRILFFKTAMLKHPTLRTHPDYARAMGDLNRWLNTTT